ncbi:Oidioi.mRNA.OKI2018_I69.XSR.g15429.t1.cds [Oikopleura dioica]|uniref:Oidioi.mRNA.OKI2018_I69.XSR.g15429.t1.cds n=1 Tax=Oikopleura dioica TaxID=34765 RepID=A0ABN7SK90_OIKDI|nr:Oidioi.mRNA.OKI2018_I69.XSR.g15429.t1.cds [Oikopleura dioica]
MSNFHLITNPTPLSQANKLELGFRQLQKTVERKFGKKEDPSIVKSDTEIDAKLSMYKDIDDSMRSLRLASRTIHVSTRALCCQDTYVVKFIQENYNVDGDPIIQALSATAEGFSASGNYWNTVKDCSDRVQRDYSTFYLKGIGELKEQIKEMEEARTDYRAALSWLRATSVDPDNLSQVEKFRRVQLQVKSSKDKFDQMKWSIQTKIDLLRVSRASLLSNAMAPLYRKTASLSRKVSSSLSDASMNIKSYSLSDYDYKILKELKTVDNDLKKECALDDLQAHETKNNSANETEQQNKDDMQLLDISGECFDNQSENQKLISDFLGKPSMFDLIKRDEDSIFTDDLLQDFSAQPQDLSEAENYLSNFKEEPKKDLLEC